MPSQPGPRLGCARLAATACTALEDAAAANPSAGRITTELNEAPTGFRSPGMTTTQAPDDSGIARLAASDCLLISPRAGSAQSAA